VAVGCPRRRKSAQNSAARRITAVVTTWV
jgi:hypothetical protein